MKITPFGDNQSHGALGNSVIYARRRGINYVKRFKSPKNPNSPDQQDQRSKFQNAVLAWQAMTEPEKDVWRANASGMVMTGYNLFIKNFLLYPGPSTTPLFLKVVNDMHINQVRGNFPQSWFYFPRGYPVDKTYARCYDNSNIFNYLGASSFDQQLRIIIFRIIQDIDIHAGDFLTLWYNDTEQIDIYFPAITGLGPIVYPADDGSTYWDPAMTNLAYAAPL